MLIWELRKSRGGGLSFSKMSELKVALIHHPNTKNKLREGLKINPDYLVTLIKRVGGYLAEITTS